MGYVKSTAVRCFLVVGLCIGLGAGCAQLEKYGKEAGRGAIDGAGVAGKTAALERIDLLVADGKLDPAAAQLLKATVDALPNPEVPASPAENGVIYGIAFLLAKLLGDAAKGFVRGKMAKKSS